MPYRLKPSVCTLICLFRFLLAPAQTKTGSTLNNLSVTVQQYYGSFVTIAPKAAYIRDSYSSFTEISVSRQTDGSKGWHSLNNYPQTGIGLLYGNPGSHKYLGKSVSLYPYLSFAVLRRKTFKSSVRLGTGIMWIEKPYDIRTNHKNILIGTHLNNYIHLSQENEFRISSTVSFNAGLAFAHVSNGSIKLPNYGLNFFTLTSGIRFSFNQTGSKDTVASIDDQKKQIRLLVSTGAKQTPWVGSPRYVIGLLSTEVVKPVSRADNIGGGVDIFYDPSITKDPSGYAKTKDKLENVQVGFTLFYERNIGRLTIPFQVGFYVINASNRGSIYQNFGARYQCSRHLSAFYNLKIHAGKADFIHYGIGYSF
jgi:hypothetical protein